MTLHSGWAVFGVVGLALGSYWVTRATKGPFDAAQARLAAEQFVSATRLPMHTNSATVYPPESVSVNWFVGDDTYTLRIDSKRRVVTGLAMRNPVIARLKETFPLRSRVDAKAAALKIRDTLGLRNYRIHKLQRVQLFAHNDAYSVNLHEWVDGVDTYGKGNTLHLMLHCRSGRLTAMDWVNEYYFEPPITRLTVEEASSRACGLLTEHRPSSNTTVMSVNRTYTFGRTGLGNTNYETNARAKRMIYAYAVHFADATVYVDAKDGSSLGIEDEP